jgi:hypothetical protein
LAAGLFVLFGASPEPVAPRVSSRWHNIWDDEDARRFVRSVNGGDETVPTVRVGSRTLTNPSGAKVAALIGGGPGARWRSDAFRWAVWSLAWLPMIVLIIASGVVLQTGHPSLSPVLDLLAIAAWWFTRPLRS